MRFDREPIPGFVDPGALVTNAGYELLSPAGELSIVPESDVKALCFVKDFESFAGWKSNRMFTARPKTEGLWVRFRLRDADQIDGLLPANLLSWEPLGFTISPPDPGFVTQRIFLPRTAVIETRLMGVVGAQQKIQRKPKAARVVGQLDMFETERDG